MIIACPSVPHTGHHFLKNRIFKEWTPCSPACVIESDNSVIMAHFDIEFMDVWRRVVKEMPVIIPLRHPARSRVSFERRGTLGSDVVGHLHQWARLMEIDRIAEDVTYFHLDDNEIRETQIKAICSRFNIDHAIDWSVNAESGSKCGTHDLEITDSMMKSVPSEFIDFYLEKRWP